ncbi:tetratricopeptide repeat protein [Nocardia sp. IFM 10818]
MNDTIDETDNGQVWRERALAELELAREVDRDAADRDEHRLNAVVAARRAVELEPGNAENYYVRARTLRQLGPADALRALERAQALDPHDTRIPQLRKTIEHFIITSNPRPVRRPAPVPAPPARDPDDETDWKLIGKIVFGVGAFVVGLLIDVAMSDSQNNQDRQRSEIPSAVYNPWATTYRPVTIPPTYLRPPLTTRPQLPGVTVAPGAVR